jgi:prevent-host-death family protein
MYTTGGVDSIATITELRSQTADLLEHVQSTHQAVMIQKNNQPVAVLISWELYKRLKDEQEIDFL